jgi:sugar transferase (PEP-CTERM/EpsH1 system associated)
MQTVLNGKSHTNGVYHHRKPLDILFLTPRFPFPLYGGDRIKSYHLLKHLAHRNNVTLVTFNHRRLPSPEQLAAIRDLGIELHTIVLNPVKAGMRCVASMINGKPLEIAFYNQPEFANVVDQLCRERQFDLGISFFMRTAEYIKYKSFPKILIAEDCRTMYQSRSYQASDSLKQKLIRWWEVKKLREYEPDVTRYFDITTLVTHDDIEGMRKQNPAAQYRLLTNGVELDTFAPNYNQEQRSGLLFSGKLDVWANEMMVKKIANELMPIIQKEIPSVTFSIVGTSPSSLVNKLQNDHIKVYPNVPRMQDYMQSAAIFLHPHQGGSGIQNKILQAMACACPVVTTPTGIQGIPVEHGRDVLIGTTDEEIIAHVLHLLRNPHERDRLARNAREIVERYHSWESIYKSFDSIIDELFIETDHHNHDARYYKK